MAQIIDGKQIAADLVAEVANGAQAIFSEYGIRPGLAVVLVGDDPASQVYVRNKVARATEAGLNSIEHRLPADTDQVTLNALVDELNNDPAVHGILVQLPLPEQLNEEEIISRINPRKDVDGFHPINVGELAIGNATLVPCTPQGCLLMLEKTLGDLSGKHAVVIGRSNIVGKPMALLLLHANCTVSIVHSRTRNPQELCKQADIVVAAVGRTEMVDASWVKEGATVIDVGINVTERDGKRKLLGDVNFADVEPVANAITPVPGGVGPMTIACLMNNTLIAARNQLS
ncbi:MAG: bifunctional methylenetetrahydrofolate dehydrogenase/methenyltetrahydrofolate cyclohydrolase FolD [Oceanospirillaceae bacterium]|uniref:bifunctional methylenetetrahydrofolate dehydrogenase/methenyltetrahydrofolate cyclohydrolase FolD n=1 Tax=unclassified Thalassolituus TaxID=2624967 RepID=UPI000C3B6D70|nr:MULTISPECIES: bifunctional methylenetetrahydrofolate dehydrogenase/methenyltetrahydrofolate cyclohydrolase FolD [unclassified Thalassolituus]MAS23817.1 bifunctional methylenetetrahydrofolate dehydrogenase/methenyltetrahydrofolate cyclohydrolase FolD [Oceanospirillaceae bacterium]MAY00841.1 bifunctional methylenetetrahydrofolate dehydrogenase/methenyltetrahydrofolate cyclohydrolase FolD [Oceanospirillaceae bacterium]MBL36663.1 bifunctional methylenetetrahydrofolate dehydrogenase/methenyltetrah|tara:strand:- start:551 stop:1411 length:861 start_codon:yes stop_codon:yes gene_type:complete